MPSHPTQSSQGRAEISASPATVATATWYDVPRKSLAARRAPDELTAAHGQLPIGSRARITNPVTGKSVVVRITDQINEPGRIDLCKTAAEKLGMIDKGAVEVRIQAIDGEESQGSK